MAANSNKHLLNHLLSYSLDMICTIDIMGSFIQVSASSHHLLGYYPEEMEGQPARNFIHPQDYSKTVEFSKLLSAGSPNTTFENIYIKKSGEVVPLSWSVMWSAEEDFFFCIARVATPQNALTLEVHQRKELHRLLLGHGSDMLALLDKNGNYLYVAGSSIKDLGYDPKQLIGMNAITLIHPEDTAIAQQALIQIQQTQDPIQLSEIRFRTAEGQWQWVDITVSNQLENPALNAIFVSSQIVTERKQAQLQVIQSEQRFRSLFQNNPDMLLYQDKDGKILDANPALLAFVAIDKAALLNRSLYEFLPDEVIPLFKQKYEAAFAGQEVRFKAEINWPTLGQTILSVVLVPLIVEEKVVAVHAVFKDITQVIQSRRTIEHQAKRLNTILESITDAFYTLDTNGNFTYINAEFERLLQVDRQKLMGENIWAYFPPEVSQKLYAPFRQAAESGQSIHLEAYLEMDKNWYEIKVYPSEEGLSVYFQNITPKVQAKKELEKLSLVASKTTNGVIITDAQGLTEWVNEGFTTITGYTLPEIVGHKPGAMLQGPETDPETIAMIRTNLGAGKPFTAEILNYKKSGETFWIHKEVTPVLDQAGEVTKFIAIQNDITEKKKAESELEKLSMVASRTSHGVIIMDTECRIEWVNEGFTRMYGYTLSEVIGKHPKAFLAGPDTDKDEAHRMRLKLAEAVPFNSILFVYRKSREGLWISIDFSPVYNEKGKLIQYIAINKDISLRKEAEEKLVKMSQDLYKHNRDLQQFTYILSHNLRAPVAYAAGLTKLLTSVKKESKEFDTALAYLKDSVLRMDEVLKDLNQILSIRDRKDVLEKERISVYAISQQALNDLAEPLRQCQAQVQVNISTELKVQAYRSYLYSIFHNLLTNALKYRAEKRILQVTIQAIQTGDGRTQITFSDNGSGFDQHKAGDDVFKLYKRFHPHIEGKGIGLYLIKTHVEAMNGQIELTSQVDVGTCFTIHI